MSEQQRQHLSELVDGELDPALLQATASAVESNSELTAAWERYHLVGSVLRGESVRSEYRDIAAAVRRSIASEPVPLGPGRGRPSRSSRYAPLLGAALAASVAFLAVFAVPRWYDFGRQTTVSADTLAAYAPPRQFQLSQPGQRWHLKQPALESKLDRFLVNHQARSPSSGIQGFFPYATVVGYEYGR